MTQPIKIHNPEEMERIYIRLTRESFPIAFQNKLQELMNIKAFETEDEAISWIESTPFEMELFYEPGYGLFLIEAEAAENGTCKSPYSSADILTD